MKIELSNLALSLLSQCLSLPGWTKNDNMAEAVRRTYTAGKILADVMPVIAPDKPKDKQTIELDDKMIAVCVIAVKHFVSSGNTPSGPAMNELIDGLKILET